MSSTYTMEMANADAAGNGDFRLPAAAERLWVMKNEEAILEIHSSAVWTKIFEMECSGGCRRWFKHCMFSLRQRKADDPRCHWCSSSVEDREFQVYHHVHCNKGGKKACRLWTSLYPPPPLHVSLEREATIPDVPVQQAFIIVEKKLSQKEMKRLRAKERAEAEAEKGV